MLSLLEARSLITSHISPLPASQTLLDLALGRVLAQDATADSHYPSADRATMDGYVVRADAQPGSFRLAGEIQAGTIPPAPLQPGETFRIFTGALLPANGARVVMQEDTQRKADTITIPEFSEQLFIREKGSEANPGDTILPAGTRLGPAELAILAQLGNVTPRIISAPSVCHIATGSELVPPDTTPGPGQIRDTNTSLLEALFTQSGVEQFASSHCPDDPDLLASLADASCDLLVISGGASVGDYDFGAQALRQIGFTIHFDKVNLRPGKPLTFATRGSQAAFVVPGNPVSHFVCYHVALRLAVELLSGLKPAWPLVRAELHDASRLKPNPRETWWPARITIENGKLLATPVHWSTSGNTFALSGVNALLAVNESSPSGGFADTLLLDVPASL